VWNYPTQRAVVSVRSSRSRMPTDWTGPSRTDWLSSREDHSRPRRSGRCRRRPAPGGRTGASICRGADGVSVSSGVMDASPRSRRATRRSRTWTLVSTRPARDLRRRSVNGRWFHAESLDSETRWPLHAKGSSSRDQRHLVLAAIGEDRPVGALNIYSRTAMALRHRIGSWHRCCRRGFVNAYQHRGGRDRRAALQSS